LGSQTWIEVQLLSGKVVSLQGFEASPSLAPLLSVGALAALLAFYIKRRWAGALVFFGMFASMGSIFLCWPVMFQNDPSSATVVIAKATGITGWKSQIDSVVEIASVTPMATLCGSFLLLALPMLGAAGAVILLGVRSKPRSKASRPARDNHNELWNETNQ
jgi:hypothetical protein